MNNLSPTQSVITPSAEPAITIPQPDAAELAAWDTFAKGTDKTKTPTELRVGNPEDVREKRIKRFSEGLADVSVIPKVSEVAPLQTPEQHDVA